MMDRQAHAGGAGRRIFAAGSDCRAGGRWAWRVGRGLLAVAGCLLVLAGCGGGGSDSGADPPAASGSGHARTARHTSTTGHAGTAGHTGTARHA